MIWEIIYGAIIVLVVSTIVMVLNTILRVNILSVWRWFRAATGNGCSEDAHCSDGKFCSVGKCVAECLSGVRTRVATSTQVVTMCLGA